jgi:hypothetical protein
MPQKRHLINADLGSPDDVGPLVPVGRDPSPEVGRGVRDHGPAHVEQTGPHLRIGKTFVDERVELVDDIGVA